MAISSFLFRDLDFLIFINRFQVLISLLKPGKRLWTMDRYIPIQLRNSFIASTRLLCFRGMQGWVCAVLNTFHIQTASPSLRP